MVAAFQGFFKPRIAAYADRIVFLKDGKIVSETQLESKRTDNAESVIANGESECVSRPDRLANFGAETCQVSEQIL